MKFFLTGLGSILLAFCIAGCDSPPTPTADTPVPPTGAEPHDEHDHGAGPHGGTIGEWGGGAYHIEFTVDHDKQEATVYVLGGDVKTPAPVKASKLLLSINEPAFDVELAAQPLPGETEGTSSRFAGQHELLGKVQEFAGSVTGEVDGTPYTGEFKEVAGHHDEKGK